MVVFNLKNDAILQGVDVSTPYKMQKFAESKLVILREQNNRDSHKRAVETNELRARMNAAEIKALGNQHKGSDNMKETQYAKSALAFSVFSVLLSLAVVMLLYFA